MKELTDNAENTKGTIELRCQCSRLLFKKLHKTLEVKCPRCKQVHVFSLAQLIAFLEAGNFCALSNQSILQSGEARNMESGANKTRKIDNR